MFTALEVFAGFLYFRRGFELAPEVRRIQLTVQHSLIDFPDLGQGE
ncbi:MAG: hypothetical protein JWQ56_2005, partial [Pseudarthrobacter sp.]|nr:hypothetical protein [Pseudarthrobacter sp.]